MPNAGMVVLPQFQGNYYDLQRQQALAQALTQQALQGSQPAPAAAVGPYQVQPKYSLGAGIAQLGQALLASRMANNVSQGYNQLGAQQAQAFGFGSPAAQADGSSNAALAQGASQGDVGPTVTNAARMDLQQASVPAAGGSAVSPMNPLGLPPALAYTAYASDPAKYAEMQAAAYKPADIVSQIRAAGIDPNSALGRQLAQSALAKATAPDYMAFRGGGYALNKTTGQMEQMPQVPEGYQAIKDAADEWRIVPVEGGVGAIKSSAAANSIGKAYGDTTTGYVNGAPTFVNRGAIADQTAGGGQAGAAAAPGGVAPGRFGGYQAQGSMPTPSLAPGAEKLAEGSADSFNALRGAAAATPTAIDGYNKAEQALLDGVTTGPGSTLGANIIGRLNTAGIPLMKGDATGYQSLQKFLSNANAQAASAGGYNGSDARFEAFSHGQPNTETMNPQALRYAIQYVRGQQAGVQAKYQAAQAFLNQNGSSTVNYPQFEAQWNRVYNPDVMMVRAMQSPADQQAYLTDLKKQGKLDGFLKSYQAMQSMGAF